MSEMNKPQPPSPRGRLQQLRAIPERERTDAEWDELNELEIMMAVGNRQVIPQQNQHRHTPLPGNRPNTNGNPQGKKQRKFHKRPPRRKP